MNTSGHPFYIQTSSGAYNSGNVYTDTITNSGAQSGIISWTIQMDAPATLYYVCQYHAAMAGTINIS
jgi:plastocyanin